MSCMFPPGVSSATASWRWWMGFFGSFRACCLVITTALLLQLSACVESRESGEKTETTKTGLSLDRQVTDKDADSTVVTHEALVIRDAPLHGENDSSPGALLADPDSVNREHVHEYRGERPTVPNDAAAIRDDSVTQLLRMLGDSDVNARVQAVSALTNLGSDEAMVLLTYALTDTESKVRIEAVDALTDIGNETAVRYLETALVSPNADVREAAISSFAEIGGEQSALTLSTVLHDTDPMLREEAVYALGDIGGDIAVALLQQALADPDTAVREAAAGMLEELSAREL